MYSSTLQIYVKNENLKTFDKYFSKLNEIIQNNMSFTLFFDYVVFVCYKIHIFEKYIDVAVWQFL